MTRRTGRRQPHLLSLLLVAIAAVLLPIDVALRRLAIRSGDAAVWAGAIKPAAIAPAPPDPTLTQLRTRLDDVRRRRVRGARDARAQLTTGAVAENEDLAARLLARRLAGGTPRDSSSDATHADVEPRA